MALTRPAAVSRNTSPSKEASPAVGALERPLAYRPLEAVPVAAYERQVGVRQPRHLNAAGRRGRFHVAVREQEAVRGDRGARFALFQYQRR